MTDLLDTKSALRSRAVWGGLVAGLSGVAGLFGVVIDPGTQHALVEIALAGGALVGGVVAVWGRLRATKRIG
jgi:hypothetical protein